MKKKTANIYKIRVTGDVLETATATRQYKVGDDVLTFGRDPIYLRAEKLPHKLMSDPYLRIDAVEHRAARRRDHRPQGRARPVRVRRRARAPSPGDEHRPQGRARPRGLMPPRYLNPAELLALRGEAEILRLAVSGGRAGPSLRHRASRGRSDLLPARPLPRRSPL